MEFSGRGFSKLFIIESWSIGGVLDGSFVFPFTVANIMNNSAIVISDLSSTDSSITPLIHDQV